MPARRAKALLAARIAGASGAEVSPGIFQTPPAPNPGELAFPCFALSKQLRRAPAQIAQEIAAKLAPEPPLAKASAAGPYVNLTLDTAWVVREALGNPPAPAAPRDETVVIDYSSPNIAKHMAVYHLRSTMIGNSLCRILRALGYRVVGVNHLGDWGTGFGKLLAAYKLWWQPVHSDTPPTITDLNELYVRFGKTAKEQPGFEEVARLAFLHLEQGKPEHRKTWQLFRDISLAEFERVYARLGVRFDEISGESVYEPDLEPTLAMLKQKGLVEESEGALVVRLPGREKPCLLKKSDGATLYATRDIAAALSHFKRHAFARKLYVVDKGQSLHFDEFFEVLKLAGFDWAGHLEHVPFGVLRFGGKKGRTREGGVILLEEVLDEAVSRALEIIRKNSPELPDPERVAAQVGIGAVVFHDLKHRRTNDIDFEWDEVLAFDGETGPYVQYAHVRACGILRKGKELGINFDPVASLAPLTLDEERKLAWELTRYGEALEKAGEQAEPSVVAGYLLDLAKAFHAYHYKVPVLKSEPATAKARLRLIDAVRQTLAAGLDVLGIAAPDRM